MKYCLLHSISQYESHIENRDKDLCKKKLDYPSAQVRTKKRYTDYRRGRIITASV